MKKFSTVQTFASEIFKDQKLTIGLDWESTGRSIALWMKRAKSGTETIDLARQCHGNKNEP